MRSQRTAAWKSWPIREGMDLSEFHYGRCAWCGFEDSLVRDHCHETGFVRGLLCRSCNQAESGYHPSWEPWRAGDNPAAALRIAEVYVNPWGGGTPLAHNATLCLYTGSEQREWWAKASDDIRAGVWPTEAPHTEVTRERERLQFERARAALSQVADVLGLGGGAA